MSDKAWMELTDLIETKYGINSANNFKSPLDDKPELEKTVNEIIFTRDGLQYKIMRTTSPRIIDKKTIYRGHGNAKNVENIYDPDEVSVRVDFYKLSNQEWIDIKPEELLN